MPEKTITIALAGNPNSGKSTLFNAMTGARQHVGNYPGVTVEKKEGVARIDGRSVQVVDLPGTYSLTAYSLEEKVVREFILKHRPDVVVDVLDASNLERNLYLAVQFRELGVPLVLALNMMDLAEKRGMVVDRERLSRLIGAPVIVTVGRSSQGVEDLLRQAAKTASERREWSPLEISYGADVDQAVTAVAARVNGAAARFLPAGARWAAVKSLEGDLDVLAGLEADVNAFTAIQPILRKTEDHARSVHQSHPEGIIAEHRYGFIAGIVREAVTRKFETRLELSDKIDRVLTHGLIGPLFLAAVLYGIYELVFWAGDVPAGWLGSFFAWLGGAVGSVLPDGVLKSLMVSGVIDGVGGVLGFVPLVMFMFLAIAVLEDTGYMARIAYLLDRLLRVFGLHGNSVVSLIVGGGISGGCAVPGIMAARTLADPKARLATVLTVPFMNCGAKLPVYALLTGVFFETRQAAMMFLLTGISWCLALLSARALRWTVFKGAPFPFVMELPPYRLPVLKGLIIHMWERTWLYLKKAGTIILAVSIVVWAMMTYPGLPEAETAAWDAKIEASSDEAGRAEIEKNRAEAELAHSVAGRLGRAIGWVTGPLGFDWQTNVALIGGFAAKEVIVSTLGTAYSLGDVDPEDAGSLSERLRESPDWSPLVAFTLMIFLMVYAPCLATVGVMVKEIGWRWAMFGVVYSTVLAYLLALGVFQGGKALGLG